MTAKKVIPRKKGPVKKAAIKKAAPRTKTVAKTVKKAPVAKASPRATSGGSRVTSPGAVSSRVVDEIPKTRRGASKSTRYRDTLAAIRSEVGSGKPVIVAEFVSVAGAAQARRQILKGNLLCDGDVSEWTFTARTTTDGSVLYAELNA